MVTLTDEQQAAILNVARPLSPAERVGSMAALAELLASRRLSLGDGELGRTLRSLQREYFLLSTDLETRCLYTRRYKLTARG